MANNPNNADNEGLPNEQPAVLPVKEVAAAALVESWSGDPGSIPVDEFLEKFESCCYIGNWLPKDRVRFLGLRLKGTALRFLNSRPDLKGCQFYPAGEYLRFVRVPENVPVGGQVLLIEVHPRKNLTLQPIYKAEDVSFFSYRDVDRRHISVTLAQSLENLVDSDSPQNVLKFRLVCDYDDGEDAISSYLSVTVYVEDINDHAPEFQNAPYHITVDELTPTGLTIFRGIHAVDRDKPNTPNSDVQYSIVEGNEKGKFGLESSHRAALVVKRPLDYDAGDADFDLTIMASDRGSPPRNSTTAVRVSVIDNDDLSPKFSRDVYRTRITEFYPLTGKKIKQDLKFDPPIYAFDQDLAIDAPIRYDIIAGNDRRFFSIDHQNGTLFLEEELDLDKEKNLPGNTFVLQVQASQTDNPLKTGVARVEIELIDLNDNLPEFEVDLYNISIVENLPNAFSVLQVIATDKDQGDNGEFSYQLEDYSGAFIMDPRSGWLTVRDQTVLDRERHSTISMKVYAIEKEPSIVVDSADNASVTVEVTLLDANDNNPMFVPSNMYEFVVESDSPIGTVVGKVRAVDPDLGRNGMVLYSFQRPTNGTFTPTVLPFTVDAQNGQILVIDSPLTEGKHALFVEASDQPSNPSERRFSLAVVTIEVIRAGMRGSDIPGFIGAPYEFWVGDNVGIGTSVGQIRVTDAVSKHDVIYDMLHSYHDGVPFAVEERTGTIAVVDDISKYEQILYDFEAVVTDGSDITLVTNVTIHVVQLDDENSEFMKSYGAPLEFRVRENLSGAFVGQIMNYTIYNNGLRNSTDPNKLKSMRFIIANQQDVMDKFAVSQDGTIYTQKGLDREDRDIYILTVITENTRGIMRGAGIYQVNVVVEDENDNPPVFERQFYEGRIQENSRNGTEVKLEHLVKASDADIGPNAMFTFTLHGEGSEMFFVDQPSGKVYLKNGRLDREEKAIYFLRIVARDKGNLNSEAKLTIHVDDINDNAPTFLQMVLLLDEGVEIYEPGSETNFTQVNYLSTTNFTEHDDTAPLVTIPENTPVGTAILRLLAGDRDAGANSSVSYDIVSETHITNKLLGPAFKTSALKNYFSINSESGTITILRTLPPETEFRLNITATDGGGLMDDVSLRIYVIDVNDHAPVFKKTWYNFDLEEGYYSGHVLGRIEASDDDHGENGNVTYGIVQRADELPFEISETDGTLRVFGTIDRESRDSYSFQAIAQDSGPLHHRRRSLVDVEVHILDVNDNSPKFYNYDHILQTSRKAIDPKVEASATSESPLLVPIYYASVLENSPPGTLISRVFANDSDFLGNGNGLLLFDIPRRLNKETVTNAFSIDSKDGLIRTAGKIDYETQSAHNITIVASDLGNPSLSSTAVVAVNVIDVQEEIGEMSSKPMFSHRYYEVEVEENTAVPVPILDVEVSEYYKGMNLRYSLERTPGSDAFQIQPRNGTLFLVKSPDREMMEKYELKVRVDNVKRGRGLPIQLYPVPGDKLADLASNEVRVIVRVKDVNDNAPQFIGNGRPIIAAIPTSANYGYQIIKVKAVDADIVLNAEIRYQILGKVDGESRKFTIDPLTGQVRSIVSFARDAGRVYGFDVKATDRRGADDGKSAITNVFVYVLDDQKQLIMVMGSKPTVIEKDMENITSILYNVTGVDVRVRKIEPHPDTDMENGVATDMFLYAVDPLMNVIIDMDTLQNLLSSKKVDIEKNLEGYHMLDISNGVPVSGKPANQRYLFSSLEVAVVVMGCIVFIGALTAAICIGCVRRSRYRRKQEKMSEIAKPFHSQLGFAISNPTNAIMNSQTKLFPSSYIETIQCGGDTTDTYVDMHSNKSDYHHHHHRHHHKHHANCTRHRDRRRTAARLSRTAENSMTSLHSSSKDSGIADRCICGHSTSPSSGDSSNGSYEDSLKSLHGHQSSSGNGTMVRKSHVTASSRRRQRQSDSPSRLRATPQPPQAAVLVSTLVRSPSDRRLTCPLTVSNDNTRF